MLNWHCSFVSNLLRFHNSYGGCSWSRIIPYIGLIYLIDFDITNTTASSLIDGYYMMGLLIRTTMMMMMMMMMMIWMITTMTMIIVMILGLLMTTMRMIWVWYYSDGGMIILVITSPIVPHYITSPHQVHRGIIMMHYVIVWWSIFISHSHFITIIIITWHFHFVAIPSP